jgi:hypothetical protein
MAHEHAISKAADEVQVGTRLYDTYPYHRGQTDRTGNRVVEVKGIEGEGDARRFEVEVIGGTMSGSTLGKRSKLSLKSLRSGYRLLP